MWLLKRWTTPFDPSNFVWALHRKLSTNKQLPFQWNTQQDVPEILQVVLDELKAHSTIARNILATSARISTTCSTCGCCNIDEVKLDILLLPLTKSISLSLDRYLSSENLNGVNKWFCPACKEIMGSTREARTVNSGSVLVLQLRRYDKFKGAVIKNNRVNCCSEKLRLPISADKQVCLYKEFTLKATINHSRTASWTLLGPYQGWR